LHTLPVRQSFLSHYSSLFGIVEEWECYFLNQDYIGVNTVRVKVQIGPFLKGNTLPADVTEQIKFLISPVT